MTVEQVFTHSFRAWIASIFPLCSYFAVVIWMWTDTIQYLIMKEGLFGSFWVEVPFVESNASYFYPILAPAVVYWLATVIADNGCAVVNKIAGAPGAGVRKLISYVKKPLVSGFVEPTDLNSPSHPVLTSLLASHELQSGEKFTQLQSPSFQVSIWMKVGTTTSLMGHAVRIHNHLVTLHHVLQTARIDDLYIRVYAPGKAMVEIPANEFKWETLTGDVAVASLEGKALPYTKNARISPLQSKQFATITTDYPNSNSSIGQVDNCQQGWGMVNYSGAARSGFCGAAYYAGNVVYGIHTVGGLNCLGYSAQYLGLFIARLESSDFDLLMDTLSRSHDRRYRVGHRTLDETEIYHQGRYYRIENDELSELYVQYPYEEYNDENVESEYVPFNSRRNRRRHQQRRDEMEEQPDWREDVSGLYELQAAGPVLGPDYEEAPPVGAPIPEPIEQPAEPTEPENSNRAQSTLPGPVLEPELPTVSPPQQESLAPLLASLESLTKAILTGHRQHQQQLDTLSQSMTGLREELRLLAQPRLPQQSGTGSSPSTQSPTQSGTPTDATRSRRRRGNGRRRSAPSTSPGAQGSASSRPIQPSATPSDGMVSNATIERIVSSCVQQLRTGLPPSYNESQMAEVANAPAGAERVQTAPRT